ncbi:unnamed protein product, partial [Linum tenue]
IGNRPGGDPQGLDPSLPEEVRGSGFPVREFVKWRVGIESRGDDCMDQLGEGISNLNQSLAAMEVGASTEGKMLTPANDMKMWISVAMTDEETCGDWLEEMGAKVLKGVKAEMEMKDCKQLLTNSLAILPICKPTPPFPSSNALTKMH